jgi:hypothetical protein
MCRAPLARSHSLVRTVGRGHRSAGNIAKYRGGPSRYPDPACSCQRRGPVVAEGAGTELCTETTTRMAANGTARFTPAGYPALVFLPSFHARRPPAAQLVLSGHGPRAAQDPCGETAIAGHRRRRSVSGHAAGLDMSMGCPARWWLCACVLWVLLRMTGAGQARTKCGRPCPPDPR